MGSDYKIEKFLIVFQISKKNLIILCFDKIITGCPTNMLTTSDSILQILKSHMSKSKTCFEILMKKAFLEIQENLVKTQLHLDRNATSERISFYCAHRTQRQSSKYKSSSCLITVRFLRSPIYSGRPSCLPIYLQGRRKVQKFRGALTNYLFMFLFLNWENIGGGRSQGWSKGNKGG